MADITLEYGTMDDLALDADRAGEQCREYAKRLESVIVAPLDALGASLISAGNTRTDSAAGHTREKVGQLNVQAEKLSRFAAQVRCLKDNAQAADERVAARLRQVQSTAGAGHTGMAAGGWQVFFASACVARPPMGWITGRSGQFSGGRKKTEHLFLRGYGRQAGKPAVAVGLAEEGAAASKTSLVVAQVAALPLAGGQGKVQGLLYRIIDALGAFGKPSLQVELQPRQASPDPAQARVFGTVCAPRACLRAGISHSKTGRTARELETDSGIEKPVVCRVCAPKYGEASPAPLRLEYYMAK